MEAQAKIKDIELRAKAEENRAAEFSMIFQSNEARLQALIDHLSRK